MDTDKLKIAIVATSLANGGAERSSALLSVMFSDLGHEVHVVTVLDEIEYPFKGTLLNLGLLKNRDDSSSGRLNRFKVFRKYLRKHKFDWVIDNRTRSSSWSEFIISRFVYNARKTVYVVRSFKIENYFPRHEFIAKLIYKNATIVSVSEGIKDAIQNKFKYKNAMTIYNPIDGDEVVSLSAAKEVGGDFIVSYGRIEDDIKNFTLLIDGYSHSVLPDKNILLYIIGEGKDLEKMKARVTEMKLDEKIIFKSKMTNPFPYVKAALFTVLTSRYEGFPRVLIESLAVGTPVVSVDCESGPREIVINEKNGLLIENNNIDALSKAMNRFVEDDVLYNSCKKNAAQSVNHLSLDAISKQWQQILSKNK